MKKWKFRIKQRLDNENNIIGFYSEVKLSGLFSFWHKINRNGVVVWDEEMYSTIDSSLLSLTYKDVLRSIVRANNYLNKHFTKDIVIIIDEFMTNIDDVLKGKLDNER